MRTEQLIEALTIDLRKAPDLRWRFAIAVLGGALVSAILFMITIGPRPDFPAAIGAWRFQTKFAVTLALTLAAAWGCSLLMQPELGLRKLLPVLALPPALLLVAMGVEVLAIEPKALLSTAIGDNAVICLIAIPLLSVAPLIAVLIAMRSGAPTSPVTAGALAGILAGAVGATFYAAHCVDDSPLFVATWYTIAIAAVAAAGAAIGARTLRW